MDEIVHLPSIHQNHFTNILPGEMYSSLMLEDRVHIKHNKKNLLLFGPRCSSLKLSSCSIVTLMQAQSPCYHTCARTVAHAHACQDVYVHTYIWARISPVTAFYLFINWTNDFTKTFTDQLQSEQYRRSTDKKKRQGSQHPTVWVTVL